MFDISCTGITGAAVVTVAARAMRAAAADEQLREMDEALKQQSYMKWNKIM